MFARQVSHITTNNNVIDGIPYTLYSEDGVFMIKAVNICDLLTHIYGEEYWGSFDITYEMSSKAVMEWCNKHESNYYAAPREDFFIFKAVREAIEVGKDTVVVEDLS